MRKAICLPFLATRERDRPEDPTPSDFFCDFGCHAATYRQIFTRSSCCRGALIVLSVSRRLFLPQAAHSGLASANSHSLQRPASGRIPRTVSRIEEYVCLIADVFRRCNLPESPLSRSPLLDVIVRLAFAPIEEE